jgi:hypothetical protein
MITCKMTCVIQNIMPSHWIKTRNYEPKKVLDVKHNQSKSNIYFFITILNGNNHGKLVFFSRMNIKELRIKIHMIQF